jgi:hypothetical protein
MLRAVVRSATQSGPVKVAVRRKNHSSVCNIPVGSHEVARDGERTSRCHPKNRTESFDSAVGRSAVQVPVGALGQHNITRESATGRVEIHERGKGLSGQWDDRCNAKQNKNDAFVHFISP